MSKRKRKHTRPQAAPTNNSGRKPDTKKFLSDVQRYDSDCRSPQEVWNFRFRGEVVGRHGRKLTAKKATADPAIQRDKRYIFGRLGANLKRQPALVP